MAKQVLDTRWLLMYIPVYLFSIWDSYRTTVDMNRVYILAEQEDHRFNSYALGSFEINYLDKRNPILSVMWSLCIPGLGQLYIHRILTALFVIIWLVVFYYNSHVQEAVVLLFLGEPDHLFSFISYFLYIGYSRIKFIQPSLYSAQMIPS